MSSHVRNRTNAVFLVCFLVVAMLAGCGDPTKKSTSKATSPTAAAVVVGMNICTTCHASVVADWLTSKHANLDPSGSLDSPGVPSSSQVSACATNCHDPNGDSARLASGFSGNAIRPVVGCEACHGGGSLHAEAGGSGPISFVTKDATSGRSAQFNTCTSCHELLDSAGTATVAATHDAGGTAPTGTAYSITDTHFATPGDWSGKGGVNIKAITGYAMDFADDKVCSNCHNPHKPAKQNRDWAQSAHADKNPFNLNADKSGYVSGAWAHYNWSTRQACQRCHTTSGFIAYANALRSGDRELATNILDGGIATLPANTLGFKPEMLKCNGCHVDNRGNLRNPGAITADYDYITGGWTYAKASFSFPDVNASNVCMACHTARESGATINGLNDAVLQSAGTITSKMFDFTASSLINSHYLTAGGTIFRATGFEFAGRSYENLATYRHKDIGSAAAPNTGSNGPCVGCHMSRPGKNGNHIFLPVARSTTTIGHIDSVASEVCIYCHTVSGAGGLEDLINERKEEYIESIEATIYVLDKRGAYFRPASPYFFALRTKGTIASVVTGSTLVMIESTTTVRDAEKSYDPDFFKINSDGTYYEIRAISSGATGSVLTLASPYTGATGNPLEYTIIQTSTSSTRLSTSSKKANVTQGSAVVTVPSTSFATSPTSTIYVNDYFKVKGVSETPYQITAVTDDGATSTITLSSVYTGATNTAATFSILKTGSSGLRNWLTQSGSGIVPASASDTDKTGRTTGRYNMGAAFNLNLLEHEPGGYVHNRMYVKRLLYDAIDWADDNVMNYSVGSTLTNLKIDGVGPVWKAGAMKYLLPYGVLGIEAERP